MKMIWVPIAASLALGACAPLPAAGEGAGHSTAKEGPVGFGETAYVDGPKVTPLELIEDSRCPKGVNCVWAGQVRIKVRVTGGSWSKELELVSGKPVQVADGARLCGRDPQRRSRRAQAGAGNRPKWPANPSIANAPSS